MFGGTECELQMAFSRNLFDVFNAGSDSVTTTKMSGQRPSDVDSDNSFMVTQPTIPAPPTEAVDASRVTFEPAATKENRGALARKHSGCTSERKERSSLILMERTVWIPENIQQQTKNIVVNEQER